jgi:hypothetical protein
MEIPPKGPETRSIRHRIRPISGQMSIETADRETVISPTAIGCSLLRTLSA